MSPQCRCARSCERHYARKRTQMSTLALRTLIGSITASALVGIYILLVGDFGDLEERVLVTALSVSALSILAMACGAAFERSRLGLLPPLGALVSVVSFTLFMINIWSNSNWRPLWNMALSLALLACAAALTCLLSLATLARRFRWTRLLGLISAFLLAAMLVFLVWADVDSEMVWRIVGVLAILVGAVTIGVPVLHRMSVSPARSDSLRQESSIRFCVACGSALAGDSEVVTCRQCGVHFRVDGLA